MRLSKNRQPGTLQFNLTPMIDIVFLLIIFFMTVAQITRTADTKLELPRVMLGTESQKTATVVINMTDEGILMTGGQRVPLEMLVQSIQRKVNQLDGDPNRVRIQLRIHRTCPSRHVTRLLSELASRGFQQVRSAVVE